MSCRPCDWDVCTSCAAKGGLPSALPTGPVTFVGYEHGWFTLEGGDAPRLVKTNSKDQAGTFLGVNGDPLVLTSGATRRIEAS
jgi:hypothetical protein